MVDKAGAAMAEEVGNVRRATDIIGEIRAASGEQSTGTGQVGEALAHIDHATQQSAAFAIVTCSACLPCSKHLHGLHRPRSPRR